MIIKTISNKWFRGSCACMLLLVSQLTNAETVNVYTERQQVLLQDILDAFEAQSGHEAKVLYLDKGTVARLRVEGKSSPADVVIVSDVGRLQLLAESGLVQPIVSQVVSQAVPAYLRDPAGLWVALTKRLRVVYVAKAASQSPRSFEEISGPEWRGKVCLRSGTHPYNIALFAAMLNHHDEDYMLQWLAGLKANLARTPQGNDRAQIKGVASGECGVGIGNLYYYFKMLKSTAASEREAAAKVRWVAASVGGVGAHSNISGVALAKHAPHKGAALALIEFMVGPAAQGIYAAANSELPVRVDIDLPAELRGAAATKTDSTSLAQIAAKRATASRLVATAGLDG